jgi:unsaturated rhamnogalacturonyl hydrolase
MGGLVRVLDSLPVDDPRRHFYVDKLQKMAAAVAKLQGADGLWRPGLLDAEDYPYPEVSGSAFFVYAMAWGINHQVNHVYADGRLGCIQPIGAAPGAYLPGASYVFGTGAFLLAGSEVNRLAERRSKRAHHGIEVQH